jgi:predicted MFS family arabinose efflux permease
MTLGGVICGLAESYWVLWLGRLISGFGAIGINVAMSKIVINWFADKEIATAMALFLAGFPGGIALALVSLGSFATADDWPVAFFATAVFSFVALVVFVLTYRRAPRSNVTGLSAGKLSIVELGMVSLSGLIWALNNAAFMIVVSFVPLFLIAEGLAASTAASLVGIGPWVAIVAVPLGGYLVDRIGRPNLIIVAGVLLWGCGLLLAIPWSNSLALLVALFAVTSLFGAVPPGPIVATASEVLRPEARAAGMGVFYTWLYAGLAAGPMLGGYVLDVSGEPASSLYLVAFLSLLTIAVLAIFRALQARGYARAVER